MLDEIVVILGVSEDRVFVAIFDVLAQVQWLVPLLNGSFSTRADLMCGPFTSPPQRSSISCLFHMR